MGGGVDALTVETRGAFATRISMVQITGKPTVGVQAIGKLIGWVQTPRLKVLNTLLNLLQRLKSQVLPPPTWDFEYSCNVCEFEASCLNPHELREKRDLLKEALDVMFKKTNQHVDYSTKSI